LIVGVVPLSEEYSRPSLPIVNTTDEEPSILQRVAQGDARAVEECLDRYSALVWSLARKQLPDHGLAEDLVQDVFIDVWKSAARFDPKISSEANFIGVIARRRLIDGRRKVGRRPEQQAIEGEEVSASDQGLEAVDRGDEARVAAQALEQLKPEHRKILVMSVMHGLSHSQIAKTTGMPLGTVKSHLRRGLEKVRALLDGPPPSVREVSS